LLKDLSIRVIALAELYCDNQPARHIAPNPTFLKCIKRLKIDYHVFCEKLQANLLYIFPISSNQQLAYVFTKYVKPKDFDHIITKLDVLDIYGKT